MRSILVFLAFLSPLHAMADSAAMDAEVNAHRVKRAQIEALRETDPKRYVDASIAWIDALQAIGEKHKAVSQSAGIRSDAMSGMMKLAAFARTRLRDPKLAIDLYRRAAKMQQAAHPANAGLAMSDRIADIEQFDLGDSKAAATHLRELLTVERPEQGEFADYNLWTKHWLEAEIAFLEKGRAFDGPLTMPEIAGFAMHLFYGLGGEVTNGDTIDPDLNPFEPRELSPDAMEKKLQPLPPSHANFLRHYLFAIQMSPDALRKWLASNDPAGFWRASILTFAAIADRRPVAESGEGGDFHVMLVRKADGTPTSLALLAREYAKTHAIPQPRTR